MEMDEDEQIDYFQQSMMDYKIGSSRLQKYLPKMVQSYFEFTEACFEEGAISQKQKQLTALGISIYSQDPYCIIYHTKGAVEHGTSEEELMEIIAVSSALGGGAAFSQGVMLALDTYDYYSEENH